MIHAHDSHRLGRGEFFGEVVRFRGLPGVSMSEAVYEPELRLPAHSHELAFFCLLMDGAYDEKYGARGSNYQPASVVFHPPDETHSVRMGSSLGTCFNVEIEQTWVDRLTEYAGKPAGIAEHRGGPMSVVMSSLYREFLRSDSASPLAVEGLVLELLAATTRSAMQSERVPPAWLKVVVEAIHDQLHEKMTVQRLAQIAGVHPVHLSRSFRQHTGRSIGEYQRGLRIQFACRRLRETRQSLADLALEAGFADQTHFCRIFKRVVGTTPARYRTAGS